MTLPSSGAISASQINVELGRASNAAFDINGSAERALAEVPSGAISFSDFYGKSNGPAFMGNYGPIQSLSPNFTSVNFGTASASRVIQFIVHWRNDGQQHNINSATIGGVAATVHVVRQITYASGGGGAGGHAGDDPPAGTQVNVAAAIISANVPTGTSGTIVVNFSGSAADPYVEIGVWRYKAAMAGLVTASNANSPGNSVSTNITVPSGGFSLFGGSATQSNSMGLTPGTQAYNLSFYGAGPTARAGGALFTGSGAQTLSLSESGGGDVLIVGIAWN